jgi:hypothetical protein
MRWRDDKGKIWLAETGVRPNRLVAFDPSRGRFTDSVATEGGDEPNLVRDRPEHGGASPGALTG